jgi:hypothetical protein
MDLLDDLLKPDPEFEKMMDDMATEMFEGFDEFIKDFPLPDLLDFPMLDLDDL